MTLRVPRECFVYEEVLAAVGVKALVIVEATVRSPQEDERVRAHTMLPGLLYSRPLRGASAVTPRAPLSPGIFSLAPDGGSFVQGGQAERSGIRPVRSSEIARRRPSPSRQRVLLGRGPFLRVLATAEFRQIQGEKRPFRFAFSRTADRAQTLLR